MDLTFEEQAYYDEFAKVYNRYGDKIPDSEWLRLSEIRKGLEVDFQLSKKIAEAVELEAYKQKYLSLHPEKQLDKVIAKVTEKNVVAQHYDLNEKRKSDITEIHKQMKKLVEYQKEQETLEAPQKVEDPGALNFLKILFSYAIGAGFIWYFGWLWVGIAVLVIETWVVIEHVSMNAAYEKYKNKLDEYVSTKERLRHGIPQLKVEIDYLKTVISENLYSEINSGCAVPLPKSAINENTWEEMAEKLDKLIASYSQYKKLPEDDPSKKEMSKKYFNKKLEFFYEVSIRNVAGVTAFQKFGEQLHEAIATNNFNLLRMDLDEKALLASKKYAFSGATDKPCGGSCADANPKLSTNDT